MLKSVKSHSYIYRLFYSLHGHYVSAYVSRRNLISLPLFLLLLLFVFVLFAIFFCHCFALLQFFRTVWPKAFYSGPARASFRVFIFMQFVWGFVANRGEGKRRCTGPKAQWWRQWDDNDNNNVTARRGTRGTLFGPNSINNSFIMCFVSHTLLTHTNTAIHICMYEVYTYVCMCAWHAKLALQRLSHDRFVELLQLVHLVYKREREGKRAS